MKHRWFFILPMVLVFLSTHAYAKESGEIVFSQQLINPADPVELAGDFQAGDRIYAVAFLEKSMLETIGKQSAKEVAVEVFLYEIKPPLYDYQQPSEMQLETGTLLVSGSALEQSYLPLDICPGTNQLTAYGNPNFTYEKFGPRFAGPVKFAERMSRLEPGEHTILVKLRCNYNFVAEGKFVIRGDDYMMYQNFADELNTAASNFQTQEAVMPKAARSDKDLEEEMAAAFQESLTYKDRVKGTILRVVIIDPDWMIRRNELTGVILHRYIRAAIAVKNGDGTCTVWQNVTFQQDYASDKFQQMKFDGIGDPYNIPCGNVKKAI